MIGRVFFLASSVMKEKLGNVSVPPPYDRLSLLFRMLAFRADGGVV